MLWDMNLPTLLDLQVSNLLNYCILLDLQVCISRKLSHLPSLMTLQDLQLSHLLSSIFHHSNLMGCCIFLNLHSLKCINILACKYYPCYICLDLTRPT